MALRRKSPARSQVRPQPHKRERLQEHLWDRQFGGLEDEQWALCQEQCAWGDYQFCFQDALEECFSYALYDLWSDVLDFGQGRAWPSETALTCAPPIQHSSPDGLAVQLKRHFERIPATSTDPHGSGCSPSGRAFWKCGRGACSPPGKHPPMVRPSQAVSLSWTTRPLPA